MKIIDAHVHVGNNPATKYYTLQELKRDLHEADAQGACLFSRARIPDNLNKFYGVKAS